MTLLASPGAPLNASVLQDEMWNCLLALETQVQTTQASLTFHTIKLARLCQATDTIAHSLQALLECLPLTLTPLQSPPARPDTPSAPCSEAFPSVHANISHPALPDAFNGD